MRDPELDSSAPRRTQTGSGLEQRVLRRTRRLDLPAGSRIVVGFSGGPDSLALLAVLHSIGELAGIVPVAVHVDHGLRPESAAEQAGAAELANHLGVPFRGVRIDTEKCCRHLGGGVEEAVRRERYRLLASAARSEAAAVIALAHHQTDQAETVLLHLLRGSGLGGAAAMAEVRQRKIPWWRDETADREASEFVVWRPLLDEPRSILLAYANELGLQPVEDPSNRDERYRRNAIRHRVLPLLEEIQPGATAALARHAALVAADDELLTGLVASLLPIAKSDCGRLSSKRLVGQPVAIQRRLLRAWLSGQLPDLEIGADRIDAVRGLALSKQGGKLIELGAGFGVTLRDGFLYVDPPVRHCVSEMTTQQW